MQNKPPAMLFLLLVQPQEYLWWDTLKKAMDQMDIDI